MYDILLSKNFIFIDTLLGCECVSVSLFDGLDFAFHKKLESYGSDQKVVFITSIIPKVVGDNILIICNVSSVKDTVSSEFVGFIMFSGQYITKKTHFPTYRPVISQRHFQNPCLLWLWDSIVKPNENCWSVFLGMVMKPRSGFSNLWNYRFLQIFGMSL